MTDQEKLARQWAESVRKSDPIISERARAAADYILEHTVPPTMADVEWDPAKHYFAGATSFVSGHDVIMLEKLDGMITTFSRRDNTTRRNTPNDLTPNGKRYELREVGATVSSNENVGADQPDRPEVLTTVKDYANAPEGTIVARPEGDPYMAKDCKWKRNGWPYSATHVAGTPRTVLRWGWGDEA